MTARKQFIYIDGVECLVCSICKTVLPTINFAKQCDTSLGYRSCCKQCFSKSNAPVWRKSRMKHKEHIRAYANKRYKETAYLRVKEYNQRPRTKMLSRLRSQKRRKYINETDDGTITIYAVEQLMEQQNRLCNYCKCDLKENKYNLDHIIPLSKGGLHTIVNTQRLCEHCNFVKYTKLYPLTPQPSLILQRTHLNSSDL